MIYSELPHGERWIDHLDVLGAVRIVPFSKYGPLDQLLGKDMDGYVCTGIEHGSQDYTATLQALAALHIPQKGLLVQHELNPGYYRFNVVHQSDPISYMTEVMPNLFVHQDLTAEHDRLIRPFMARYPKDTAMLQQPLRATVKRIAMPSSSSCRVASARSMPSSHSRLPRLPVVMPITFTSIPLSERICSCVFCRMRAKAFPATP